MRKNFGAKTWLKRPLLIGDDFVLVGFKESDWGMKLK